MSIKLKLALDFFTIFYSRIDSESQDIVHKLTYLQIEYLIKHNSSIILDANAIRQHNSISKLVEDATLGKYLEYKEELKS